MWLLCTNFRAVQRGKLGTLSLSISGQLSNVGAIHQGVWLSPGGRENTAREKDTDKAPSLKWEDGPAVSPEASAQGAICQPGIFLTPLSWCYVCLQVWMTSHPLKELRFHTRSKKCSFSRFCAVYPSGVWRGETVVSFTGASGGTE